MPDSKQSLTAPSGYTQLLQHRSQRQNCHNWDKTEIFPKPRRSQVTLEGGTQR